MNCAHSLKYLKFEHQMEFVNDCVDSGSVLLDGRHQGLSLILFSVYPQPLGNQVTHLSRFSQNAIILIVFLTLSSLINEIIITSQNKR